MDCSILVVDDTPHAIIGLSGGREGKGYPETCALEGRAALHTLEEKSYHLFVADLKLSQVNGCNIHQKANSQKPDTMPVFLAGSYDTNPSKNSCILDVDDTLFETWDNEKLLDGVTDDSQRQPHRRRKRQAEESNRILNEQIPNSIVTRSADSFRKAKEGGSNVVFTSSMRQDYGPKRGMVSPRLGHTFTHRP